MAMMPLSPELAENDFLLKVLFEKPKQPLDPMNQIICPVKRTK